MKMTKGLQTGPDLIGGVVFAGLLVLLGTGSAMAAPGGGVVVDDGVPFVSVRATVFESVIVGAKVDGVTEGPDGADPLGVEEGPRMVGDCSDAACYRVCDADIANPFCAVVGAVCEATGGGGAACHCSFFCGIKGGRQFDPHTIMQVTGY